MVCPDIPDSIGGPVSKVYRKEYFEVKFTKPPGVVMYDRVMRVFMMVSLVNIRGPVNK